MQRSIITLPLLLMSLLLFTACSTLPINGKLPEGLIAEKIASVDKGAPFALSPDNNVVAIVKGGLKLFHIPSKEHIPVEETAPSSLAWSPLGNYLAAIFAKEEGNSIVVYDKHGTRIAESSVNAGLTGLYWLSEDELLAAGFRIRGYKFGSNYQSLYFSWKPGRNMPVENALRDTTLQPVTVARWKKALQRGPMLALPLQSGALLYLHPVDPPLFTPYYKLIMKELSSGKELEIATVALNSSGGRFSADGEKVLYSDGNGATLLYDPWTEELLLKAATPGTRPALSPEGEKWVCDGALFRKDEAALPLVEEGEAQFSMDGSRIILSGAGGLYLLSGLKAAEGTMFVPAVAEKVAKLRSMRAQRLVTPQEYKENMLRITNP